MTSSMPSPGWSEWARRLLPQTECQHTQQLFAATHIWAYWGRIPHHLPPLCRHPILPKQERPTLHCEPPCRSAPRLPQTGIGHHASMMQRCCHTLLDGISVPSSSSQPNCSKMLHHATELCCANPIHRVSKGRKQSSVPVQGCCAPRGVESSDSRATSDGHVQMHTPL